MAGETNHLYCSLMSCAAKQNGSVKNKWIKCLLEKNCRAPGFRADIKTHYFQTMNYSTAMLGPRSEGSIRDLHILLHFYRISCRYFTV